MFGVTTLSITTFSIITFSIMSLSIMTFSTMTFSIFFISTLSSFKRKNIFSIMTLSTMTLISKHLFMILSLITFGTNITQRNTKYNS
jgi:hypothetical protein